MVYITKNSGGTWEKISDNLPKNLWVSRVIASKHKKERVYVTLNGYRFDDFTSYVYKSEDYGKTWTSIANNIPASPVNVIKEDPANENVLYLGTDNGAYVSLNKGKSWDIFNKNLPNVAVHDLVIQPEAKHLILGTHGRSLYKANIAAIQSLTDEVKNKEVHIFSINSIRKRGSWGSSWSKWLSPNTPEVSIPFYVNSNKKVSLQFYLDDVLVNTITKEAEKGFNEVVFDVSFNKKGIKAYKNANKEAVLKSAKNGKTYLPKGTVTVKIANEKQEFTIK